MTDRDALLNAILANPLEDVPRLAYADWCAEHGEPDRAEFIRLSLDPAIDNRRMRPFRRMKQLAEHLYPTMTCWFSPRDDAMLDHDDLWLATIFRTRHTPELLFSRGFAIRFRGPWTDWKANADTLTNHNPTLARVTLRDYPRESVSEGGVSVIHIRRPTQVLATLKNHWPTVAVWDLPRVAAEAQTVAATLMNLYGNAYYRQTESGVEMSGQPFGEAARWERGAANLLA